MKVAINLLGAVAFRADPDEVKDIERTKDPLDFAIFMSVFRSYPCAVEPEGDQSNLRSSETKGRMRKTHVASNSGTSHGQKPEKKVPKIRNHSSSQFLNC
jgi:hypothetical protein